jgi:hypothetical protein
LGNPGLQESEGHHAAHLSPFDAHSKYKLSAIEILSGRNKRFFD